MAKFLHKEDLDESTVVCLDDIEKRAMKKLPKAARDYFYSGADDMATVAENLRAFERYRLLPRMLVDVSRRDIATRLLGSRQAKSPIGLAPSAHHKMAHPDGELASARAAQSRGCVFVLSSYSTTTMEEVAEAAPDAIRWFQLYVLKDTKVTRDLVRRAEKSGYEALVLTVDAQTYGRRNADIKNKYSLPSHLRNANFDPYGDKLSVGSDDFVDMNEYIASLFDTSLTWKALSWLRSFTSLPIVVKGILRTDDALLAVMAGASAVWLSNHGGRQLDHTPAAINLLPDFVAAVGDHVEVYVDGGIRRGTDALKCLALGAKAVFVGRPVVWGLAWNGQAGVEKTLDILNEELLSAIGLVGCNNVQELNEDLILAPKSRI